MDRKLIVPFLFCNMIKRENYAWIFCKYVDFCLKNDMPIIVEEEYCVNKDLISAYKGKFNPQQWNSTVPAPEITVLENCLKKVTITRDDKETYFSDMDIDQSNESRKRLCLKENSMFEKLIDKKLDEIEEKYGEISVIMTWVRYPALAKCAERRGIRVLSQELCIIRGNDYYKEVFGSFNFGDKYTSDVVKKEYLELEKLLTGELILSREEILAYVLQTEHLDVINRLYEPIYDVGIDADPERDMFFEKYSTVTQESILDGLRRLTDNSNVLARFHPSTKPEETDLEFDVDSSVNSMEWILKCRRIVSAISNVGFEAMLLGRTSYVLCENIPYYLGNVHTLDMMKEDVADIRVLNYLLFGYYVPWSLMFDCDYINWRLSGPEPQEVYRHHLIWIFEKIGLSYEKALEMTHLERYKYILKHKHNLSDEEMASCVKRSKKLTYTEMKTAYDARLDSLKVKNERLSRELAELKNSTSWKVTRPLRNIGTKVRKKRRL